MRRRLLRTSAMILAVYMALTGSMTAFAGEQAKEEKGKIIRQKEERTTEKEAEDKKAEEEKAEEKKAEEKKAEETKTEEKGTEEKDAEDKDAGKETGKPEEVVYIGIDNSHIFEGMKNSYAEGYAPEEKENKVKIVVPFTVDGELKNNFITVGLDFGRAKDVPFQIKNYQRDVKPRTFTFDGEDIEIYLYTVEIPLQETRKGGQYPIKVKAEAMDKNSRKVSLENVVFVSVAGNGEAADGNGEIDSGEEIEGTGDNLPMEGGQGAEGDGSGGQGNEVEEVMHQPKFILEQCSLDGNILDAGSSREAELIFRNKSREFTACNVKLTIAEEGEGNNLVFGRTSEYYETVKPGSTITWKEELQIQDNAKEGNVPVKITFEYEDEKGTAYTGTETYTFRIRQPAQVSLVNYSIPAKVYSTDTISSDLQILNLGKSAVYNVKVSSQGKGIFSVQTFYAGTLEAGQSLQGSLSLYAGAKNMESIHEDMTGTDEEKYGKTDGALVLEYEDIYGQTYSHSVAYETEILEPQILSLKADKKEEETNQWWVSVLVLLGLGLTGGFVVQSLRIRSLKKPY